MSHENPVAYAKSLATYIADPSTIRVRVLEEFGRAPSVDIIANIRAKHVQAKDSRKLCGERFMRFTCGHDYDEANTYIDANGYDRCKTCRDKREEAAKQAAADRTARQQQEYERQQAERRRKVQLAALSAEEIRKVTGARLASEVVQDVAAAFGLTIDEIKSKSRLRYNTCARMVAYKLLHERGNTLSAIGRWFGRDHSTIIHGVREFDARCKVWPELRSVYEALR